mgnify:CR=1 FL=1
MYKNFYCKSAPISKELDVHESELANWNVVVFTATTTGLLFYHMTYVKSLAMKKSHAAIFAIFTAQVWNMILSFYQSVRNVPSDLREAASMFHLSAWQCFWKIEVPFAMPGLLWNAMISMSGSWVFLVASEAISVAHQDILLPGIGSYISVAISQANSHALWAVIITMFIVIFLYDQIIFRPLVAWSEKFKANDEESEDEAQSWLLDLFHRTAFFVHCGQWLSMFAERIVNLRPRARVAVVVPWVSSERWQKAITLLFWSVLSVVVLLCLLVLWQFIFSSVDYAEGLKVIFLGFLTALRVFVLIIISCLIWVPIGVLIGLSPKASKIVQPIAQFFAAFPANLLFPVVAMWIVHNHLNVNIWVSPLMILGTQWYILFNVIAGVMALPKNMHHAVGTLNVRGWLWWYRFVLPGILGERNAISIEGLDLLFVKACLTLDPLVPALVTLVFLPGLP